MLGNLHVRFGVGAGVKFPGLHHAPKPFPAGTQGAAARRARRSTILTRWMVRGKLGGCRVLLEPLREE